MRISWLAFGVLVMARVTAADLTTRDGQVYHNYRVIDHDIGYITIMDSDGGGKIPLSNLPADLQKQYGYDPAKSDAFVKQDTEADRQARAAVTQAQAAQQIESAQQAATAQRAEAAATAAGASRPASAPSISADSMPAQLSPFASKFANDLVTVQNGAFQDPDLHPLAGVKYWAFYYSASWCPPCRAFTPSLVSFYKSFKPSHPDFELIFVNDDHAEDDMLKYMTDDDMPWPAVRFSDARTTDLQKYCGDGIPCLVLVDETGTVISDTNRNGQYMGPQVVVDDIKTMVK
jgi:thiol-disulfide isomerase/thioredoxin